MGQVIIGRFAKEDGVIPYRVNGSKDDLKRIITECRNMGYDFDEPELEFVRQNQYSMYLQLRIPEPVTLKTPYEIIEEAEEM